MRLILDIFFDALFNHILFLKEHEFAVWLAVYLIFWTFIIIVSLIIAYLNYGIDKMPKTYLPPISRKPQESYELFNANKEGTTSKLIEIVQEKELTVSVEATKKIVGRWKKSKK